MKGLKRRLNEEAGHWSRIWAMQIGAQINYEWDDREHQYAEQRIKRGLLFFLKRAQIMQFKEAALEAVKRHRK